ncbi:MAG: hypothetical protein LBU70_00210 [Chitinispirillales bacterium]|jgi:V/A-type H+-transporting ATPase subunit I|nr:hypothetical protein [Chitinispirillales bacterium]
MIVKMRKMDLLLYHREREKFLEELRGLGVVHIASEQPADTPVVQELLAEVQRTKRIAVALKKLQAAENIAAASAPAPCAMELLNRYEQCEAKKDKIEQESATLSKDRATLTPWGNFDPKSVKRLQSVGVEMKFYVTQAKKFEQLNSPELRIEKIADQGGLAYFVVIFRGEAPEVAAEEVRLPDMSLKAMEEKLAALATQRDEASAEIKRIAAHVAEVEKFFGEQVDKLKFEEASLSMVSEAEGKLLKLSGWVPQKDEANVAAFLQNFPAYVSFRDPASGEDVPVKLKNRPFSRLFEPVLGLYSLPGYREIDVAPFVAPFFTLFFGLCLGDAGYGFVIALASAIAMGKVGPKMKPIFGLGLMLGLSTMLCGVLLNGVFGFPIFGEGGLLPSIDVKTFAPLASEGAVFPAMSFAILVGFVQVFLGMAIQSYVQMRERGFFAGLQPISTILMAFGGVVLGAHTQFLDLGIETFTVGPLLIGEMFLLQIPFAVGQALAIGGLVMLLLFNSLDKIIFMRPLTGLWAMYNFITGFLSNILSYLRLFALGLAGGLLGGAVNQIAFMFVGGADEPNFASIGVVLTIAVMIGGHALNLGLSALGSFVHPLRLTFVEFYGAVGFEGGSKPYIPFAKVEK